MDSFNFTNLQAEKANAMLKHRKLQRIASMLRLVEVCVVLVLISRLPMQLPIAVKNSSEYFREFYVFMNSPRFVFFIGNAIIITLFAQSGQFSAQGSRRNSPEPDLYQEFIQSSTKNQRLQGEQKYPEKQNIGTEDSLQSEKQSMRTEDSIRNRRINRNMEKYPEDHNGIYPRTVAGYSIKKQRTDARRNKWTEKQSMKTGDANVGLEVKGYRRCQAEILSRVQSEKEKPRGVLRRCETENRWKSIPLAPPVEVAGNSYPEDVMSNDEFRRTVEAFIARQQRLRREEDYSLL